MINSTQDVVHAPPAERVGRGATTVDPAVKHSQTALDVVQHLLPLVVIQVTHAVPQTNSQLAPLTADFLYDIQLGENFDSRLALSCVWNKGWGVGEEGDTRLSQHPKPTTRIPINPTHAPMVATGED